MKNKKKILLILFLFIYLLCTTLIFNVIQNDENWNYGFAHNIYSGLIPYKDFNMVITPFYPFFISLFFHIFGSSMLVFHIINAILLTMMFCLIYKILDNDDKFCLVLVYFLLLTVLLFPCYNIFMLFLVILLLFLEEKKSNDYLIGIVIAIALLSKQSVGIFLILPSLYYLRDKKKILKRFIGLLVPCFIFLIVLVCTKSLNDFINYCVLGLFDFGKTNTPNFNFKYLFFIIYVICVIYFIKTNKKDINNYYLLAFSSMMIPLFDFYHILIAYSLLLIIFIKNNKIKRIFNYKLLVGGLLVLPIITFYVENMNNNFIYPNNLKHYEYRFVSSKYLDFSKELDKYINKYSNKKYVILNSDAYFVKLTHDEKLSKIDLINDGNLGCKGEEKIIKYISNHKDYVYFVSEDDLNGGVQTNKKVINYVIKNAKKIDSMSMIYDIYVFE